MARDIKYLLRKASGSRRDWIRNGSYRDDRNKKSVAGEEFPMHEGFKQAAHTIDTTPLKRWLYSQVGNDFNAIYSEFISRLQPKYLSEYRNSIFWYVEPAKNISFDCNGYVFGHGWKLGANPHQILLPNSQQSRFYVDPATNKLCVISSEQRRVAKQHMNTPFIFIP